MYQFIENIKSDKAFFFHRGSVALYALLKAVEIEPGDEVILQSFTCDVVPATIVRAEGVPIYVDIDPKTFNMDPGKIEARITARTKAIIVQHTYGIPAEMEPILDIARRHALWVIEDSCHALGSKYDGQEVGTFGDAAFYSFGWHKPLVLGTGGAAVVNNPTLKPKVEKIYEGFVTPPLKELMTLYVQYLVYILFLTPSLFWRMREVYRRLSRRGRRGLPTGTSSQGEMGSDRDGKERGSIGPHGKRMIPFQKRRLFRKLSRFDGAVAHQRWVVSRYEELVSQTGHAPLELDCRFEPVYYKYPLLCDCQEEIFEKAPRERIELSYLFASPLYPQRPRRAAYWRSLGYRKGMCPISEDVSDRIVALPVHAKVRAKDIERTIAFLASFRRVEG